MGIFGLVSPNLRCLVPPPGLYNTEKVNSLHSRFPPLSMEEEEAWLQVTLLGIYLKLKAHWASMASRASCSDMPSHPVCIEQHLSFNRSMTPNWLWKGYLTKKESDRVLRQMTWPPQSQLRWFGMRWTAEWRQKGQQVLNISGNSFKTVGRPIQAATSWRSLRECQSVQSNQSEEAILKI